MMRRIVALAVGLAALAAGGAGCAASKIHVVGDEPADVYVAERPEGLREAITQSVKERLDIDSPVRYAGRTTPDGFGNYRLRYKFDDYPEDGQFSVIVKSARNEWHYRAQFDERGDKVELWYPQITAGQRSVWDRALDQISGREQPEAVPADEAGPGETPLPPGREARPVPAGQPRR